MSESVASTVLSVSSDNSSAGYTVGSNISINVEFDESVYVTGNPRIKLEIDNATHSPGDIDRYANYSSGDSSSNLNFIYTVVDGDNSTHLHYTSTSSLSANGGTIRDNSSNDATLTLPSPGSSGSLGDNKTIVIDARAPIATLITTGEIDPSANQDVVVKSTEIGTAYLVCTDKISVTDEASITNAAGNGSWWKSFTINAANTNIILDTAGLQDQDGPPEWTNYHVFAVDALGNFSDPSSSSISVKN